MRYKTTNGRTDRRTYLKAIGAGALATGMAGVAGCLGAEAEKRNGTGGDSGSTAVASESQGGGTKTDALTNRESSATANENSADSSANEVTGAKACFDDIYLADTSEYETYRSEDGYTIKYPAESSVDENDSSERSVVISTQYGNVVSISVEPTGGKALGDFASMYLDSIRNDPSKDEGEELHVLCRSEIALSSGQTGEFIQLEMEDDQPGALKRNGEVLLVIANGTLYRIDSGVTYSGGSESGAIVTSFALGGGN